MRRPAHGGTARPGHPRPGNGFGAALRPGPARAAVDPRDHRPVSWWFELELGFEPVGAAAEPIAQSGAPNRARSA